jgi:hypothetical protein
MQYFPGVPCLANSLPFHFHLPFTWCSFNNLFPNLHNFLCKHSLFFCISLRLTSSLYVFSIWRSVHYPSSSIHKRHSLSYLFLTSLNFLGLLFLPFFTRTVHGILCTPIFLLIRLFLFYSSLRSKQSLQLSTYLSA